MKQKLYNHFKSKSGFTLIELLVVIGILAVLAAIAIPAVAGLIDRANVSADKTNSNEMTNAVERFASEYELYKNDLAIKGVLPVNEMDAMQGRVYSVIGVNGRSDITELETLGSDNAILINDERYPTTDVLMKKVVEAYTKTGSSTFEPKQSDKCFWYSPECGVVVVAGHNSTVLQKNELVVSGKDAKGNDLDSETMWYDLTDAGEVINNNGGSGNENVTLNLIPVGGIYNCANGTQLVGDGVSVEWPETVEKDDFYTYNDITYRYTYAYPGETTLGWTTYSTGQTIDISTVETTLNKKSVISLNKTYRNTTKTEYPSIPDGFAVLNATYQRSNITTLPILPNSITHLYYAFEDCSSLTTIPDGFAISESVKNIEGAFSGCTSLTGNLVIEGHPTVYTDAFKNIDFATQGLVLVHNCGNADCTLVADLMATNGLS